MTLPEHLHRAWDLFEYLYDRSGGFALLPLDILRCILAPMLLHPYRIVFSDGEEFMLGLGNERFIGRENISCNGGTCCSMGSHEELAVDSFHATGYGWIVGYDDEVYMIGRHGRFTNNAEKVGHILGREELTFAQCHGGLIQIRQLGHCEEIYGSVPAYLNYRSTDVPARYNRVVSYQTRYGYVQIVLWDGDRGICGQAYDDPSYENEFMPGSIVRSWERRLPHRPACIIESYDEDHCEAVYPWGESERISIEFTYE